MKTLELSFEYHGVKYFHPVRSITTQDYIFNGELRPREAIVVDGTAFPLAEISDIRLTVLEGA